MEQILDIKEAAKFYLVQEIMEDCESYHGSCKLYKDRDSLGTVDKWKFGPVWDFGNAYDRHAERWIYDGPTWPQYWIGQLIYMFEKGCGISGYVLGVNPFNQPGVEAYKKNMFALLGKPGYEEESKKILSRIKK